MNKPKTTPKGAQKTEKEQKSQTRGKSPKSSKGTQLAAHQNTGGKIAKNSKRQSTNTPVANIPLPPQNIAGETTREHIKFAAQKRLFHSNQQHGSTPNSTATKKKLAVTAAATPQQQQHQIDQSQGISPAISTGKPRQLSAMRQQNVQGAATPPTTVAEAQELGEQARLRDEVLWALEGLASGQGLSRQESLATIVEVFSNRRSRMALHAGGIGAEVLNAVGRVDVESDSVIALGCATILLYLSQVGSDAILFSREDFAAMTAALLKNTHGNVLSPSSISPPAQRILKLLHDPPLSRYLPREASYNPVAVTLTALSYALDPQISAAEAEPIKNAIRVSGCLKAVAQIAADQTKNIDDAKPTMETVHGLWKLQKALLTLEHACFACVENESHLITMEITQGTPPIVAKMSLPQWLVQQMHAVGKQGLALGLKKECLRGFLAVLMNITQNNTAGCDQVLSVGGAEMVSQTLAKIATIDADTKGILNGSEALVSWIDELSSCLGLLINLAEDDKACRERLRRVHLETNGQNSIGLVQLLSRLIGTAMDTSPQPQTVSGKGAAEQRQESQQHEEVTLDSLQHGEGEAIGSIIEVYAAILLGFLVEGDAKAQKEAAEVLPGKTLAPVVLAVQRCLHFYVNAGALTQRTETSLRALLASLEPVIS